MGMDSLHLCINVVSGYYQLVKSLFTGRITWRAYNRTEICYDCDERKDKWCKVCMCYIPAKVRAKDAVCPRGYWKVGKVIKGGRGVDTGGL